MQTDIKNLEQAGVKVELSWTPGHSDIKGNDLADKLAKEAAEEAKEKKDLPPVITMGDVKTAARESGRKKWQDMWEKAEAGRHLLRTDKKWVISLNQGAGITVPCLNTSLIPEKENQLFHN